MKCNLRKGFNHIWAYRIPYLLCIIIGSINSLFRQDTSTDSILENALSMVLHNGANNFCPYTDKILTENISMNPMSYIYAGIASLFHVHPMIIGKLLMPLVVIVLFTVGSTMFVDEMLGKESRWNNLIIIWWLGISGTWCLDQTWDFTDLYVSPWTSKSILLYCVAPLCATILLKIIKKKMSVHTLQIQRVDKKQVFIL